MDFRRIKAGLKLLPGLFLVIVMTIAFVPHAGSDETNGSDEFNLNVLIDRVSSSKALGFLTKLSLKRDIDRFLDNVGRYHKGTGDLSLEQLRERYDVLVHNLVVLVQDKDEELVKTIDDGRDKLWALLADEKKFASL